MTETHHVPMVDDHRNRPLLVEVLGTSSEAEEVNRMRQRPANLKDGGVVAHSVGSVESVVERTTRIGNSANAVA
jgi:hypothetical protein